MLDVTVDGLFSACLSAKVLHCEKLEGFRHLTSQVSPVVVHLGLVLVLSLVIHLPEVLLARHEVADLDCSPTEWLDVAGFHLADVPAWLSFRIKMLVHDVSPLEL